MRAREGMLCVGSALVFKRSWRRWRRRDSAMVGLRGREVCGTRYQNRRAKRDKVPATSTDRDLGDAAILVARVLVQNDA